MMAIPGRTAARRATRFVFRKKRPPVASHPGALAHSPDALHPRIHVVVYDDQALEERDVSDLGEVSGFIRTRAVTWIDVQGLGDHDILRRLAELFRLHSLAMADVVNTPQRPKIEAYEGVLFAVTRMARCMERGEVDLEQVSIFLGHDFVLTFQERYGDVLDPLRARIRAAQGLIRRQGPDYLAYAILDAVIDGYYPVLEQLGEDLAALEEEALERPSHETLRSTNRIRGELLTLRRVMWPQREALQALIRDPNPLIGETVRLHLRDVQDHCVQTTEVIVSYREIIASITNTYLSSVSNRTNEVMKVLTIMASIFIPLTFLAGVYGMNFDYMPELHKRYAYPAVLAAMVVVALAMLFFFWRKGWLGSREE